MKFPIYKRGDIVYEEQKDKENHPQLVLGVISNDEYTDLDPSYILLDADVFSGTTKFSNYIDVNPYFLVPGSKENGLSHLTGFNIARIVYYKKYNMPGIEKSGSLTPEEMERLERRIDIVNNTPEIVDVENHTPKQKRIAILNFNDSEEQDFKQFYNIEPNDFEAMKIKSATKGLTTT